MHEGDNCIKKKEEGVHTLQAGKVVYGNMWTRSNSNSAKVEDLYKQHIAA